MKILQITNKVPVPPKDGGSIASIRLAEGLAHHGHEVQILAMNTSKHFVEADLIKKHERKNLRIQSVSVDTRIKPLKALINLLFSRLPYNAVRFISSDFREALTSSIKKYKPDLIILENLYPGAYIRDIKNSSSAPVAYRAHNVEHEIWGRMARNASGLKKWYLGVLAKRIKNFEKSLINKYNYLVPITRRDEEALDILGNKMPSFVLPTGYNSALSKCPVMKFDKAHVAHLGALDWLPNQEGLIWFRKEVWPLLKAEIPDAEFHLAGRNAPAWFEQEMNYPGIIFHGEIENAEKFITSYPIHIVPLFSGSGMRIKIVEAMAYGRAVITTSIGTEGIDTQHNKNIIIADTQEGFKSEIEKAIRDTAYCREIGENAFTFVAEKLNNEKMVGEFLLFLENHK